VVDVDDLFLEIDVLPCDRDRLADPHARCEEPACQVGQVSSHSDRIDLELFQPGGTFCDRQASGFSIPASVGDPSDLGTFQTRWR
jgi:hypothetical protein